MTDMTPAPISVERLRELLAKIEAGCLPPQWENAAREIITALPALLHQLAELEQKYRESCDITRDWIAANNALSARAEAAERAMEEARILIEDAGSALRVMIATAEAARWPITAEQMVPMSMARKEAGRIAAFLAASGGK